MSEQKTQKEQPVIHGVPMHHTAVPDDAAILAHFHAAKDPDAHLHSDPREVVYQLTQEELLQAARAMLEAAVDAAAAQKGGE